MNYDDLCECYHLSSSVLGELESCGLFESKGQSAEGGDFSREDVCYLKRLFTLKEAGIEADVIKEIMDLEKNGKGTVPRRLLLLEKQRKKKMTRLRYYQQSVDRLDYLIRELRKA